MTTAAPKMSVQALCKYIQEGNPLYVRNNAFINKTDGTSTLTQVAVRYTLPDQDPTVFAVPRTKLCFNICDFIRPEALVNSMDFHRLWAANKIVMASEEEFNRERRDSATELAFDRANADANHTQRARFSRNEKAREKMEAKRAAMTEEVSQEFKNMQKDIATLRELMAAGGLTAPALAAPAARELPQRSSRYAAFEASQKAQRDPDGKGYPPDNEVVDELIDILGDITRQDLETIAVSVLYSPGVQTWARQRLSHSDG
jgi:DNA-binding protein H-NS